MRIYGQNSLWAICAWATTALFYAYHQVIISAITVIPETFIGKYDINMTQYGFISVIYTIAYAAMQIPVGIMLDHFSVKRLFTTVVGVFSVGCFILATTDCYSVVIAMRFIMGVAAAFSVLGSFKIAAEWFSPNQFATLTGLTVSLGYFGSMLGNSPFLYFLKAGYSYEAIFFALGIFGVLLTISSFVFVGNYQPLSSKSFQAKDIVKDLTEIMSSRLSWVLIIYAMLIFTPLQVFKDSLGVTFFTSYYGYSKEVATHMMNAILMASVVAAPLLGVISDRMQKRRPVIVTTPAIILLILLLLISRFSTGYQAMDIYFYTALTALFGFMTWGFLLSYTVFKETHSPHLVSVGLGLMNSINMVGGIFSVPFITVVMDLLPKYKPGIETSELYFYAFLILPAIILVSFPLLRHIPETNCKQLHD